MLVAKVHEPHFDAPCSSIYAFADLVAVRPHHLSAVRAQRIHAEIDLPQSVGIAYRKRIASWCRHGRVCDPPVGPKMNNTASRAGPHRQLVARGLLIICAHGPIIRSAGAAVGRAQIHMKMALREVSEGHFRW
ncbi:hypothetical protein Y900_006015 [Mycolicibacterium aromaticivorans JS19b1 = JCM 16368]|uniref:Uncharacterized protein n=1 Tax=Mycolicibacterium aromaticivorans JS19b1 = JCM 16368 TaxID=1440774 RepID=A0A064CFQ5_9MYCO|nr:hypothetical protein Y900_006015 [Mycolicibacterium aromaticivorans JS19b1 = JCM 16368]